jgi:RNA polymerase sigma-70 factor (ECF subfamily)
VDLETIYIQQIIDGDINRFSWFVEKYQEMAFATAMGILDNSHDAEETVQDAFLRAFRSLRSFKGNSKFSTWLCRITINTALSRLKKNKTVKHYEELELAEEHFGDLEACYNQLNNQDQSKYIRSALEKLNPDDRLILTLYYLNEQSIEEISNIIGSSQENVKMRLHRARRKMYGILSKMLNIEINII